MDSSSALPNSRHAPHFVSKSKREASLLCPTTVDLDELKFAALEHCSPAFLKDDAEEGEERSYLFLERCDRILQQELHAFLTTHPLPSFSRSAFREQFARRVDRMNDLAMMEEAELISPRDCLEVLEEVEDPARSWLLYGLFKGQTLDHLYLTLDRLSEDPNPQEGPWVESLRQDFETLLLRALVLEGEERSRLHVKLTHGNVTELLYLLYRFLTAHLEFARVIQEAYLERFPELPQRLWQRLLKEVLR